MKKESVAKAEGPACLKPHGFVLQMRVLFLRYRQFFLQDKLAEKSVPPISQLFPDAVNPLR